MLQKNVTPTKKNVTRFFDVTKSLKNENKKSHFLAFPMQLSAHYSDIQVTCHNAYNVTICMVLLLNFHSITTIIPHYENNCNNFLFFSKN